MATNGSFNTSAVGNFYFTFSWSRTDYDSSKNEHYIYYEVIAHNTAGNYRTVYLKNLWINGTQYFYEAGSSSSGKAYYDGNVVTSGNITIPASNSAGDGYISASFEAGVGSYPGSNCSGEKSWDLDRIPRHMDYVYVSQRGKTSSSVSLDWSCSHARDWTQYSLNDGSWKDAGDVVNSGNKSGYFTVSGLSANTKYSFKVRVRRTDSGLWSESTSMSVTTYAKTTPTISLSSKSSSSITVTSGCNVTVSSTQYRIKKSGGSYGSYQTSATFSGLSANTTYVVEVKKVGKDSGESGTATLSVTTYAKTTPTISLSSKTVNSITVTSSCNVTVSSTQYRIKKSGGSYGSYQTSATFSGLIPNTAYVVEVKKVGKDSGESGTATVSVTTYDIPRLTTYPNFNLGDSVTIKFTNPSGIAADVGLYDEHGKEGFAPYRAVSGTSYTFNFTDDELDKIYKTMTSNTLKAQFYICILGNTYRDSREITINLTGNQKTGHIKSGSSWKRTKRWINVNGSWKRCVRWVNINGTWKKCI